MKTQINFRFGILSILVFTAVLLRICTPALLADPFNFSPIAAIALFSGAYFRKHYTAFIAPIMAVWCSDVVINYLYFNHISFFYSGFLWQYSSYLLIALLGFLLVNRTKPIWILASALLSSWIFFIFSNFGVWISGQLYPLTLAGLHACFIAAIPFYKNTLLSNLFYCALLFTSFEGLLKKFPFSIPDPATSAV